MFGDERLHSEKSSLFLLDIEIIVPELLHLRWWPLEPAKQVNDPRPINCRAEDPEQTSSPSGLRMQEMRHTRCQFLSYCHKRPHVLFVLLECKIVTTWMTDQRASKMVGTGQCKCGPHT
jgi:hypothetical protein